MSYMIWILSYKIVFYISIDKMSFKKLSYHIIVNNIFEYGWPKKLAVFYFKHDKFRKLYFSTYSYSLNKYTKHTKYLIDNRTSEIKQGTFHFKVPSKLIYLNIMGINFSLIVNINDLSKITKIEISDSHKFNTKINLDRLKKNLSCLKNNIYYIASEIQMDYSKKTPPKLTNLRFITHKNTLNNGQIYKNFKDIRGIFIFSDLDFNRLGHIRHLELSTTDDFNLTYLSDKSLKYVPNLRVLDIPKNMYITDKGLKYVPKLKVLIATKYMTDEGMKHLNEIQYLDISKTNISSSGIWEVFDTLRGLNYDKGNNIDYNLKTHLRYKNVELTHDSYIYYDMESFI